eukprot:scaffold35111_cov63-Phaeocystis_antarctica.AAC.1
MQVNTAQGIMSVTVPQGVMPGQCFTFQLPAAPVVQGVVGTAVSAMHRYASLCIAMHRPSPHPSMP